MTCVRCQGLVIDDAGDVRCLNCGWRPVGEAGACAGGMAMKCKSCSAEAEAGKSMCRPHLDAACAAAKEAYRRKREAAGLPVKAAVKGDRARTRGGTVPEVVEPEELESPRPRNGHAVVLTAIDQAIAIAQADLDALERTRGILSRS